MKKEILVAAIIGLALGLIITYGVYTARTALFTPPSLTPTSPTTNTQNAVADNISISSPTDNLVTNDSELTVAGKTDADSFVVVVTNHTDSITTADATGNFSVKVKLDPGSNLLTIASINENGQVTTSERTVAYLNQDLADLAASAAATIAN